MDPLWGNASPQQMKLFAAAEPLLLRYGYRKTTVEEICRGAGVSKRSFYELFRDKGDLLAQLSLAVADSLIQHWRARSRQEADARQRLEHFLDAYAELCRERPILHMVITEPEILARHPEFTEQMMASPIMEEMNALIEDGVSSGEFRSQDPAASTLIVFSMLDTLHILLPQLLGLPGPLEDEALARQLRHFVLAGLGVEVYP